VNNEFEGIWKRSWPDFNNYTAICFEGLLKATNTVKVVVPPEALSLESA
jgi:hypothetical protein